jgi:hypothetical protein
MLIRASLFILLASALAACGISSDYDIGKELKPVTPMRAGTYVLDPAGENPKPGPVMLRGNTYLVESTNDNGSKSTAAIHFYRIAEFDGYIMQVADAAKAGYGYFYTRVTDDRLEILDEDIEGAVLPPHLADLFVFEKPAGPDENGAEAKAVRTTRLKSDRDILVILRAMAGAKYPMKVFGALKRIG